MKSITSIAGIFILFVLLLTSCKTNKISTQGIEGKVFWVEGNQMPQASDNESKPGSFSGKIPIKRTIHIHELTHINEASLGDYLFGTIETPLVAVVETNDKGQFNVKLPAGKYSLFTVEANGYFASIFDLDSYIHPVTVEENKWSLVEIIIDYKASY